MLNLCGFGKPRKVLENNLQSEKWCQLPWLSILSSRIAMLSVLGKALMLGGSSCPSRSQACQDIGTCTLQALETLGRFGEFGQRNQLKRHSAERPRRTWLRTDLHADHYARVSARDSPTDSSSPNRTFLPLRPILHTVCTACTLCMSAHSLPAHVSVSNQQSRPLTVVPAAPLLVLLSNLRTR